MQQNVLCEHLVLCWRFKGLPLKKAVKSAALARVYYRTRGPFIFSSSVHFPHSSFRQNILCIPIWHTVLVNMGLAILRGSYGTKYTLVHI